MDQETRILEPIPDAGEIRITARDWLDEVGAPESTLDFPAIEGDIAHRERIDTPRVRHLFPVPEDADWEVQRARLRPLPPRRLRFGADGPIRQGGLDVSARRPRF